jgi:hypothetical protein
MMCWESCASGLTAGVSPEFSQEVRETVEYGRLIHEALRTVDETDDLEHLLYPIQGAGLLLKLG